MNTLSSANLENTGGMFPIQWNITSGKPFACKCNPCEHFVTILNPLNFQIACRSELKPTVLMNTS